jgi:peptide/nickel transport system permease protein
VSVVPDVAAGSGLPLDPPTDLASPPRLRHTVSRAMRNRLSLVGLILLAVLLVTIVFGPLVWRVDPAEQDLTARLVAPSPAHPISTDANGRDMLSRVLNGGRVSLGLGVTAVVLAVLVGGTVGLLSGFFRGPLDLVLMRFMDVILSFPSLLLALAIAAAIGPGVLNTLVAVAIPGAPLYARLMRSMVISVREREYVVAARAAGVRPSRIMLRYVLRNSVTPVIIQASLGVGLALQSIASLGYLGLGVQPPTPEWGAILSDAQTFLLRDPVVLFAPGLFLAVAVVSFNLLGDTLRDLLDPT